MAGCSVHLTAVLSKNCVTGPIGALEGEEARRVHIGAKVTQNSRPPFSSPVLTSLELESAK